MIRECTANKLQLERIWGEKTAVAHLHINESLKLAATLNKVLSSWTFMEGNFVVG